MCACVCVCVCVCVQWWAGCQPIQTQIVSRSAPLLLQRRPHTVLHATLDNDQVWMLLPAPVVRGAWLAYPVRRWDGASFGDVSSRLDRLRDLRECCLFAEQTTVTFMSTRPTSQVQDQNKDRTVWDQDRWRASGLKPISQLRFDYDTTTIRLRRKIDVFIFARVESRRMEAGARDAS